PRVPIVAPPLPPGLPGRRPPAADQPGLSSRTAREGSRPGTMSRHQQFFSVQAWVDPGPRLWRSAGMNSGGSANLVEASGSVCQHGVDLAGLRRQIAARHHLAAIVARDLVEQALEFGDIAVDRLLELAVGAVSPAHLVEGLLTLQGVEAARECVALAAVIAIPQVHHGVVVDHAGDVGGDRVERVDAVARRLVAWPILVARRAGEQVREPSG